MNTDTCSAYLLQRIRCIISLPDEQLVATGTDFLFPTASTVASTLNFAMVFLLIYPEVQTKMQQEMDTVVGRDRLPTLDDRARSVETSVLIKNIIRNIAVLT